MTILLSQTPNNKVNFLLNPHPYTQLFSRLKTLLKENEGYQFFAIPEILSDTTNWTIDMQNIDRQFGSGGVKSYNDLSDEDKDEISDYSETIKEKITAKIANDNTFANLLNKLFFIPDKSDIKIIKTKDGILPVLTQWGCQSNETTSSINALSEVINRSRTSSAKVIIQLTYTDGSKAADRFFYIEYHGKPWKFKTNDNGIFIYGRLRLESDFQVYDLVNNQKTYINDFSVLEAGEYIANVVFPLLVSGVVIVVNQKDTPLADSEIIIEIEDKKPQTSKTDKTGKINLDNLEVGKKIKITEKVNSENTETYTIVKDNNIFKLIIVCPFPTTCTIIVQDIETCENQKNYLVLVEYEGTKNEYNTKEEAVIQIDELIEGKDIRICEKNKMDNYQIHKLNELGNDYILKISIPKPVFFKIKVIEHRYFIPFIWGKKKNLENIVVDFINNKGEKQTRTTDRDGCIGDLPVDEFGNNQKVKALVHLDKIDRKGRKKEKIFARTFILKKEA